MTAALGIEIDDSRWPLLMIRFPSRAVTDDDMRGYLDEIGDYARAGEPYTTLTDLRRLPAPLTAAQQWIFDEWMQSNFELLDRRAVGNAVLVGSSVSRAVVATAYRNWRNPPVYRVFDSLRTAVRWCRRRIEHRRVEPAAIGTPNLTRAPAPDRLPATAQVIDMFREPAFLVADNGAVVFANRAALRAFAPPWAWLERALSEQPRTDEDFAVRVTRVQVDGRFMHLVIADEGAYLADLPPSLRRVARLLARGLSDKEIAGETGLSFATVRTYVRRLYARAGVHSRAELLRVWFAGD